MRITSSGNVGINTTSPSRRLEVSDTSAQLRLSYDGSNYTDLTTNSLGNLTIAPTGGYLSFTGKAFSITSTANYLPQIQLFNNNDLNTGSYFMFYRTRAGSAPVASGDALGNIWWNGMYNSAYQQAAYISAGVDGSPSGDYVPGVIRIGTGTASATPTERMRITSSGNVGINTTSPSKRLEVRDTSSQLRLSYDGSYYCDFSVDSSGQITISPNGGNLIFTGTIGLTGSRVTQSYHTNITSTNAVTVDSDARWKEDIQDTYGLDIVNAIPARSFKWREDSGRADGVRHQGFVAQEFRQRLVELGIGDKDLAVVKYDADNDEYGLATGELIPIMWRAIQQLSAKVAILEAV
jgi:hypothetical protein